MHADEGAPVGRSFDTTTGYGKLARVERGVILENTVVGAEPDHTPCSVERQLGALCQAC